MSFWNSDHKNVGATFETGGGDFEPIPANTGCVAAIKQAAWAEYHGDRYINIQWQILAPEQYKNRVVFQKLRVLDDDAAKADRAKRMLAAIDANAGGKLLQLDRVPDDSDLALALTGRIMAIKLQVWEMVGDDGQERSGNWVSAVAPAGKQRQAAQPAPAAAAPAAQAPTPAAASTVDSFVDNIPF